MSPQSRRSLLNWVLFPLFISMTDVGHVQARQPVDPDCQLASERALPSLAGADRALALGDARTANAMLDTAIRVLGNRYHQPDMLDDTGMHLTLANIEQGKGKLRVAAGLKRNVLKERLELCGVRPKPSPASSRTAHHSEPPSTGFASPPRLRSIPPSHVRAPAQ